MQQLTILGNNTLTNGCVGGHTTAPLMPLHIFGDANNPTCNGWARGLYLENHAVIAFAADGNPNALFMGHPAVNPAGNFYCGLAANLNNTATLNHVYRIIRNPIVGVIPPSAVDFQFLSPPKKRYKITYKAAGGGFAKTIIG